VERTPVESVMVTACSVVFALTVAVVVLVAPSSLVVDDDQHHLVGWIAVAAAVERSPHLISYLQHLSTTGAEEPPLQSIVSADHTPEAL